MMTRSTNKAANTGKEAVDGMTMGYTFPLDDARSKILPKVCPWHKQKIRKS